MMKTNEKSLHAAMDRRLSFLDDIPSCRAAVKYRIAQEEEPVMKKKVSVGFVFAMILALLSVAAVAAGLLLSPRATAVQTADREIEKVYGITAEMQTFFGREEEELEDGAVKVTYTGAGDMSYVLGTYTVLVKDGKAEAFWSREGENVTGGYEAEAWGSEQLKQMVIDAQDPKAKRAYMDRAKEIARAHDAEEDTSSSEMIEGQQEKREADKTAAMNARKVPEEDMIATGREFIISNYGLNEEQIGRMELFTRQNPEDIEPAGADPDGMPGNAWYEMVNGQPCFQVEYLLYQPLTADQMLLNEKREYTEKDGYYIVYVNVETGEIEQYEYNSALGGEG